MGAPVHILVVEDDADIAALYGLIFGAGPYTVTAVGDLATARARLATRPLPDLILLDLHLPDGHGLDLCREVTARHPALPVVVVTAVPMARDEALAAGACCFMPKPFDPEALEAVVDRWLGERMRRVTAALRRVPGRAG